MTTQSGDADEDIHHRPGRDWSNIIMAGPEIVPTTALIINLDDPPAGHRLAELLQALTGCSIERAELAIGDPTPSGPATPDEALDCMARAMVALKSRSDAPRLRS